MKVGIFSPYLETMGGGERYLLTVAEFFQNRGDSVDLFYNGGQVRDRLQKSFNLDLSKINFTPDVFFTKTPLLKKLLVTVKYDLIFFLSDGSVPSSLARENILHFQRPFNLPDQYTLWNKIKLSRFSTIICNSYYTKKGVDRTYRVESKVVYPPVDIENFSPGKKGDLILSVGRFFSPSHPKKQEVLIDTFAKMVAGGLKNYRLALIGSVTGDSTKAVNHLKEKIAKLPATIITNASFSQLQNYYSQAKIYWHATGFSEDLEVHPDRAEHFGITTVEAMSAGCVPIVFAGGGQKEIITNGKNGYFWANPDELAQKTLRLIADKKLMAGMSQEAVKRSKDFSKENFFVKLDEII